MATAKRMAVASWFPVDLANARLHRAMLDHGELRSVGETSQQEDIGGGAENLRGLAVDDLIVDACRELARGVSAAQGSRMPMTRVASEDGIVLVEAPNGSDLYAQALRLREAILRRPLGLALTEEEIADDAGRRHFCAMADGAVIGSLSLKPLGPHTLQLRQMAVAGDRQREGIGARLLAYAGLGAPLRLRRDHLERPHRRRWFLLKARLSVRRRGLR